MTDTCAHFDVFKERSSVERTRVAKRVGATGIAVVFHKVNKLHIM